MAGRGPAGKPASTRARRNATMSPDRVIEVQPGKQPKLPSKMPLPQIVDGEVVSFGIKWPAETTAWWKMWAEHPIADDFTDSDWSYLLDTALLHGAYWNGDLKQGAELRQRVAKFGATPEDRARLRIQYAVATKTEAEVKKPAAKKTTKKAASARSSLYAV